MNPETAGRLDADQDSARNWWRIGDIAVLLAYVCITSFTLQYHEKWADEAQAWLLARDLGLKTLWLRELRYEGSPGLWHTILWVAQHVFHARYGALGPIGLAFAIGGAALLIFQAPFPRLIRWPLAFTYAMVYQYAVIARSYTMLPLLVFVAAILFKDLRHPGRITVTLILLANLALHGAIIAGSFAFAYALNAIKAWPTLVWTNRMRLLICGGALAATFSFLYVILKPTPDVQEFSPNDPQFSFPQPTRAQKAVSIVSGAFLDFAIPSFACVVLVSVWCYKRKALTVFALPFVSLVGLYSLVHGYAHHHGIVYIAAIAALWIAWPTTTEVPHLPKSEKRWLQAITVLLMCICAVNIWDAAVSIQREYRFPYCGAEDAANYLKAVEAERGGIFGYIFGVAAVQAYFDHNIFLNIPTTYTHHGLPLHGAKLEVEELRQKNPEYIVAYSVDPQRMWEADGPVWRSLGYDLVHFSDGYFIYKRSVAERESYLIFRRIRH